MIELPNWYNLPNWFDIPSGFEKEENVMDNSKGDFTMSAKDMVVMRLKELINRTEGSDKCTICEAIRQLETPPEDHWNGSWWMILLFLIFFGYGNNSTSFDFETFKKIFENMNDTTNSEEESK